MEMPASQTLSTSSPACAACTLSGVNGRAGGARSSTTPLAPLIKRKPSAIRAALASIAPGARTGTGLDAQTESPVEQTVTVGCPGRVTATRTADGVHGRHVFGGDVVGRGLERPLHFTGAADEPGADSPAPPLPELLQHGAGRLAHGHENGFDVAIDLAGQDEQPVHAARTRRSAAARPRPAPTAIRTARDR